MLLSHALTSADSVLIEDSCGTCPQARRPSVLGGRAMAGMAGACRYSCWLADLWRAGLDARKWRLRCGRLAESLPVFASPAPARRGVRVRGRVVTAAGCRRSSRRGGR